MTFFTNSKKYAKKIKKAEKCVVYENTVRELFSCEQFKKGAEAKGHQVKIVRIMEQNIGFCRACDGCMRNGGTCVLKDDMAEILKMFQKADVLVLATPVYFYRYHGTAQGSVQARTLTRCSRKSPSVMAFWLVCLGILTYSCQNTSRDSGY